MLDSRIIVYMGSTQENKIGAFEEKKILFCYLFLAVMRICFLFKFLALHECLNQNLYTLTYNYFLF